MFNRGLSYSTDPYDCTSLISVTGFAITAIEPVNSLQSVAFKIGSGGQWSKLGADGSLTALPTQTLTAASLLVEGNTLASLRSITNIAAFVGQKVYLAVAMQCSINDVVMPSLTLNITGTQQQGVLTKVEETPVIPLVTAGEVLVNYFDVDSTVSNGTVSVEVIYLSNGVWSLYAPIASVTSVMAGSVKYRMTMTVGSVGGGTVTVNSISAVYNG